MSLFVLTSFCISVLTYLLSNFNYLLGFSGCFFTFSCWKQLMEETGRSLHSPRLRLVVNWFSFSRLVNFIICRYLSYWLSPAGWLLIASWWCLVSKWLNVFSSGSVDGCVLRLGAVVVSILTSWVSKHLEYLYLCPETSAYTSTALHQNWHFSFGKIGWDKTQF